MAEFRPKQSITFPNQWAVDSFLLKLKNSIGWEFKSSNNKDHFQINPKGSSEGILIGLNKGSAHHLKVLDINAEKFNNDEAWKMIHQLANLYRC